MSEHLSRLSCDFDGELPLAERSLLDALKETTGQGEEAARTLADYRVLGADLRRAAADLVENLNIHDEVLAHLEHLPDSVHAHMDRSPVAPPTGFPASEAGTQHSPHPLGTPVGAKAAPQVELRSARASGGQWKSTVLVASALIVTIGGTMLWRWELHQDLVAVGGPAANSTVHTSIQTDSRPRMSAPMSAPPTASPRPSTALRNTPAVASAATDSAPFAPASESMVASVENRDTESSLVEGGFNSDPILAIERELDDLETQHTPGEMISMLKQIDGRAVVVDYIVVDVAAAADQIQIVLSEQGIETLKRTSIDAAAGDQADAPSKAIPAETTPATAVAAEVPSMVCIYVNAPPERLASALQQLGMAETSVATPASADGSAAAKQNQTPASGGNTARAPRQFQQRGAFNQGEYAARRSKRSSQQDETTHGEMRERAETPVSSNAYQCLIPIPEPLTDAVARAVEGDALQSPFEQKLQNGSAYQSANDAPIGSVSNGRAIIVLRSAEPPAAELPLKVKAAK